MTSKANNKSVAAVSTKNGDGARKSVGTAAAAVTLAAVTVLSASGLMGAPASGLDSASILSSPPNSVSSRIAGVQADMARAVELQQVTPEQAAFLENQLIRQIQSGSEGA